MPGNPSWGAFYAFDSHTVGTSREPASPKFTVQNG
ncbi:hypothetical protein ABH935_009957 [Catenulispora sp. GAS73]